MDLFVLGLISKKNLRAADISEAAREKFSAKTGITVFENPRKLVADSDIIFLAVKPNQIKQLATSVVEKIDSSKLIVSIAAGVPLARLAEWFGEKTKLVRVMPNTPCLVGEGAGAFCAAETVSEDEVALVEKLLAAGGTFFRVGEKLLDAVTGLSGCGSAYAFLMIEALSDGGVRMGLPRDMATKLAAQTLAGASAMVLETGQHPGELKDQVTSPGGATIAGIHALETGGLRGTLIEAVRAATVRSSELGK